MPITTATVSGRTIRWMPLSRASACDLLRFAIAIQLLMFCRDAKTAAVERIADQRQTDLVKFGEVPVRIFGRSR